MSPDQRGVHLLDCRETDRQSSVQHSFARFPGLILFGARIDSVAHLAEGFCAERVVTSPPSALNDVLAFEIRSPSTSAENVATTAIDTDTVLLVSSQR